jgi:hypothetical protein
MPYLYGFISTAISVLLALTFIILDVSFHSISLLFIVPIGALAFGFIASYGYFKKKKEIGVIDWTDYIKVALIGLLAFFLVNYGEYALTYVSKEGQLNHNFNGSHISNFSYKGKPIVFSEYIAFKLEGSEVSVKPRRGGSFQNTGIELGAGVTTFKFVLQAFGFVGGSLFYSLFINSENIACSSCRKSYLKEYKLFSSSRQDYDVLAGKINSVIQNKDSKGMLNLVDEERLKDKDFSGGIKMSYYLGDCKSCKDGFFIVKVYTIDNDGSYEEATANRIVIPVDSSFVKDTCKISQVS